MVPSRFWCLWKLPRLHPAPKKLQGGAGFPLLAARLQEMLCWLRDLLIQLLEREFGGIQGTGLQHLGWNSQISFELRFEFILLLLNPLSKMGLISYFGG